MSDMTKVLEIFTSHTRSRTGDTGLRAYIHTLNELMPEEWHSHAGGSRASATGVRV
jgi:hypothetical protein